MAVVSLLLAVYFTADVIGWVPLSISGAAVSGLAASYYAGLNNYSDTDYKPLNMPFPKAVEEPILQYKPILDVPMDYDIYLDSISLHWSVIVRANMPGANYPYVTFEISRNNSLLSAINDENSPSVPIMNIVHPEKEKEHLYRSSGFVCPTLKGASLLASMVGGGSIEEFMLNISGCYLPKKGTIRTTMRELSEIAERIRQEMGTYNLYSRNCRHFANKFLVELGLPTTPDTMDKPLKKFRKASGAIIRTFNEIMRTYGEVQKAFDEFQKEFAKIFDENEIGFIFFMLLELQIEIKSTQM